MKRNKNNIMPASPPKRCLTSLAVMMLTLLIAAPISAQEPFRVGTTSANFLEIGFGSAGSAMGDAHVSMSDDLSSIYWNPAGLAFMQQNEALFLNQPWVADINTNFAGVGLVLESVGTLAFGVYQVGYGDIEVTSLDAQEGTGESYTANDFAFSASFARSLAQWFSFGASAKYITSQIWHMNASALAVDLGVVVNTQFFSFGGKREDGLKIGMSISNFGSRMKYDGTDLINPIDILPDQDGNFRDAKGQFRLDEWELPLIFRLGVSLNPIVRGNSRVTLAADALHPNNNAESVNLGAQYALILPGTGSFFLRGGYKALFMDDADYGFAGGAGMVFNMLNNVALKVDYAYRGVGILGKAHTYSFAIRF